MDRAIVKSLTGLLLLSQIYNVIFISNKSKQLSDMLFDIGVANISSDSLGLWLVLVVIHSLATWNCVRHLLATRFLVRQQSAYVILFTLSFEVAMYSYNTNPIQSSFITLLQNCMMLATWILVTGLENLI